MMAELDSMLWTVMHPSIAATIIVIVVVLCTTYLIAERT